MTACLPSGSSATKVAEQPFTSFQESVATMHAGHLATHGTEKSVTPTAAARAKAIATTVIMTSITATTVLIAH